ncbi:hypothetical protein MAR_026670 [Mya arenaria]|uniref:Uncharacterized protein n=1 Tax=Mya arenaria TaxID=6604 RepID=A0ABY7ET86_MYAAR|nr:hypothetical protein MAR_026670 [Mya arenaria]
MLQTLKVQNVDSPIPMMPKERKLAGPVNNHLSEKAIAKHLKRWSPSAQEAVLVALQIPGFQLGGA